MGALKWIPSFWFKCKHWFGWCRLILLKVPLLSKVQKKIVAKSSVYFQKFYLSDCLSLFYSEQKPVTPKSREESRDR